MTTPPPDGYNQDELLAMELPNLGNLRQATERVAEAFTVTAGTLTPAGNPMDTCYALREAAEMMVALAKEYGRYFAGIERVQADPHKAWLADYEQQRAKKGEHK